MRHTLPCQPYPIQAEISLSHSVYLMYDVIDEKCSAREPDLTITAKRMKCQCRWRCRIIYDGFKRTNMIGFVCAERVNQFQLAHRKWCTDSIGDRNANAFSCWYVLILCVQIVGWQLTHTNRVCHHGRIWKPKCNGKLYLFHNNEKNKLIWFPFTFFFFTASWCSAESKIWNSAILCSCRSNTFILRCDTQF